MKKLMLFLLVFVLVPALASAKIITTGSVEQASPALASTSITTATYDPPPYVTPVSADTALTVKVVRSGVSKSFVERAIESLENKFSGLFKSHDAKIVNLKEKGQNLERKIGDVSAKADAADQKAEKAIGEATKANEGVAYLKGSVVGIIAAIVVIAIFTAAALIIISRRRESGDGRANQEIEESACRIANSADTIENSVATVETAINSRADDVIKALDTIRSEIIGAIDVAKEEIPARTIGLNKLLEPFTLENIHGNDYLITPVLDSNGKVRTLKITSDVTDDDEFEKPGDVPRVPAKSPTHLKATNAKVLTLHFDPSRCKIAGKGQTQAELIESLLGAEIKMVK